jgi:DNA-binding NarL/FixJ family response regulator
LNNIVFYSTQPILAAGMRVAIADLIGFNLAPVSVTIDQLVDQLRAAPATLALIDMTTEVTLEVLQSIQAEARGAALVLWVDTVSTEFASQLVALGVRGILRKRLSIDLQLKCLQKVADGELWFEKTLTDQLITTNRVALTRRERQLLGTLAKGLKNKEIAYELGISEGTVKVYLSHLFRKVGANDRFDLALFALRTIGASGSMPAAFSQPSGEAHTAPLFMPGFIARPAA